MFYFLIYALYIIYRYQEFVFVSSSCYEYTMDILHEVDHTKTPLCLNFTYQICTCSLFIVTHLSLQDFNIDWATKTPNFITKDLWHEHEVVIHLFLFLLGDEYSSTNPAYFMF